MKEICERIIEESKFQNGNAINELKNIIKICEELIVEIEEEKTKKM